MSKGTIIPLVIGLLVGVGAIKVGMDFVKKAASANRDNTSGRSVVVATKPIPLATTITKDMVKVTEMPESVIPDGAFAKEEEVIGRVTRSDVSPKMPLVDMMLSDGAGLGGVIPKGYRAVAVKVNEFSGVAGFVKPGDHVDVVCTFGCGRNALVSKTILQDIMVRAVGQSMREGGDKKGSLANLVRSVTLLATPEQAEAIQLATTAGQIRLALRGEADKDKPKSMGVRLSNLMGGGLDKSSDNSDAGSGAGKGLWSMLGAATAKPQPQPVVTPVPANPVAKRPTEPYVVELLVGDRIEKHAFVSEYSNQRVNMAARTFANIANSSDTSQVDYVGSPASAVHDDREVMNRIDSLLNGDAAEEESGVGMGQVDQYTMEQMKSLAREMIENRSDELSDVVTPVE